VGKDIRTEGTQKSMIRRRGQESKRWRWGKHIIQGTKTSGAKGMRTNKPAELAEKKSQGRQQTNGTESVSNNQGRRSSVG